MIASSWTSWARDIEPPKTITRVVDLLCALWATLTSDLTGRALSRAVATGTGKLVVGATGAPISLAPSGLRFAQQPCVLPRK
jgi:hypothetical protein